tara:strand:- start:278 stop:844 length:567 start_codon:yes stop_codon:yes gene_type:complete
MKEWIGYYKDILSDEVSNGIMNIKDGWKASTYANHKGNIGVERSKERVIMDELYITAFPEDKNNNYWNPLVKASRDVIWKYREIHTYGKWFQPDKTCSMRVNRYDVGGFMSEHVDNIHHSHKQEYGFPQGSLLFFLNDNYEGGEIVIADTIYKPKKNSAILFPSCFMFPHYVKKVEKGVRYSIITWLM